MIIFREAIPEDFVVGKVVYLEGDECQS